MGKRYDYQSRRYEVGAEARVYIFIGPAGVGGLSTKALRRRVEAKRKYWADCHPVSAHLVEISLILGSHDGFTFGRAERGRDFVSMLVFLPTSTLEI